MHYILKGDKDRKKRKDDNLNKNKKRHNDIDIKQWQKDWESEEKTENPELLKILLATLGVISIGGVIYIKKRKKDMACCK